MTIAIGSTIRHDDNGLTGTVLGTDDRGYFDVLRQDGLRVVWAPRKVSAA